MKIWSTRSVIHYDLWYVGLDLFLEYIEGSRIATNLGLENKVCIECVVQLEYFLMKSLKIKFPEK